MVSLALPVKQGLSAPAVNSIPKQWDPEWFRRFITNYLQNTDIKNTAGNIGVTVGGTVTTPGNITVNLAFLLAPPTATVGLTPKTGVLSTLMRSDAAPALDQSISPTMTGLWDFAPSLANQTAIIVTSSNAAAHSNADVNILRAGSTANAFEQGPNIQLTDSVALTFTTLQQSGGQTELWMGQGASQNKTAFWNSGRTLTLTPATNQTTLIANSQNGSTTSNADVNIIRAAGSTANAFAEGPNVQLTDSSANTFTVLQQSGGNTELWMGTGATQRHAVTWNNSGAMTILQPPSGNVALTVNGATGNVNGLTVNAVGGSAQGDFQVTGTFTGTITGNIQNLSTGVAAATNFSVQNSAHVMVMEIGSTTFTGSIIPGSPTGEAALLASNGAIPLMFGTNHTYAGQINPNQGWQFNPTSGVGVTITGVSAAACIVATSGSTASTSNSDIFVTRASSVANTIATGPNIELEDLGATTATMLQHSGGQTELWQFNGSWNQAAFWDSNRTLHLKAATNITTLIVNGQNGAAVSNADVNVQRAGSTVNAFEQGPNIQLTDSTNSNATVLQNSGAQSELWQGNSGTNRQMWVVPSTGGFLINVPYTGTGTTLTLGVGAGGVGSGLDFSAPANTEAYERFIIGGGVQAFVGCAGAAGNLVADSAANDYVIRTQGNTLRLVPNTGTFTQLAINSTSSPIQGRGPTSGTFLNMTPDTGSFTATATGLTTSPTCAVNWYKNGNVVTLAIAGLSGTSNANTFALTGLPALLQPPSLTQNSPVTSDFNNGTQEFACQIQIVTGSGTINLLRNNSVTGWTAAGTKALNECVITYMLV